MTATASPELAVNVDTPMCRSTAGSLEKEPSGRRRFAALAAVLLVAAVVLGGCRTARTVFDTTRSLQDAHFDGVRVGLNRVQDTDRVRVTVRASSGPAATPELQAAHIVWDTFRFRFDAVDVKIGGKPNVLYTYGQLQQLFGPRPAAYDARTVRSDLMTGARQAVIAGGIIALIVIAGVIVTVVLVVRHRRRRPPPPWYGPGPPPGQQGWPQPAAGGWAPPGQQPWPPPGQQPWPPPGQQPWPPPGQPGQGGPAWPPPGEAPPPGDQPPPA